MKSSKVQKNKIKFKVDKKHFKNSLRVFFWFSIGAFVTLFLIASFSYLGFQHYYKDKVYPGVSVNGIDFSNKTEKEVRDYFTEKNNNISDSNFTFIFENEIATASAKEIEFGYDENLLTTQAMSIGRSNDPITSMGTITQAYLNGVNLSPAYKYTPERLDEKLDGFYEKVNKKPVEAVFNFQDGRVAEFRASENGREIDHEELTKQIMAKGGANLENPTNQIIKITIPTKVIKPTLTTDKVNKMGITELIGSGTSTYKGSIDSRIFNVNLGASRINGTLVPPGEVFSFAKTVGDISSLTGYKQAYIISGGKTILGDGGGICQVSTTLFRAALNAGLPIVERHPHAYRVSYYEQDSPPGVDATVYVPTVDLKFKNDTGHHILIQSILDPNELRLTFMIYGTSDGRISEVSTPVVGNIRPAPEAKYEDDPTLPAGQVKQVDFSAAGATAYFTRKVTRDGKIISSDEFRSNYRPWQAVFLRGTKTE